MSAVPTRGMRSRRGRAGATRTPRGENRRRLLEAVADRPGATAGQLAGVTGIARATATSTLAKLVAAGELQRTELPAGGVGFKVAEPELAEAPTPPAETDDGGKKTPASEPNGFADAPTDAE